MRGRGDLKPKQTDTAIDRVDGNTLIVLLKSKRRACAVSRFHLPAVLMCVLAIRDEVTFFFVVVQTFTLTCVRLSEFLVCVSNVSCVSYKYACKSEFGLCCVMPVV